MTNFILAALVGLPLFFLPWTQDFYDTNKWMFLVGITIVTGVTWALSQWKQTHILVSLSKTTISFGLLTTASLMSLLLTSTNNIEAILSVYGPVTFACFTLLSLFFPILFPAGATKRIHWFLPVSLSLLGLLSVYQFAGMGKVMFPELLYLNDPIWTPTGSLLATSCLLLIGLPLTIKELLDALSKKHEGLVAASTIMTLALFMGLGVSIWLLIPRLAEAILPMRYGWAILLEIFNSPKQALFGVGAENFLTAFSTGRPASINTTPLWNIRFATNASLFLHITTIYGITGALAMSIFLKQFLHKLTNWHNVALLFCFFWILLFPPNISVLVICVFLLLLSPQGSHTHVVSIAAGNHWVKGVFFTLIISLFIGAFYLSGRAFGAELVYYRSVQATKQNHGTDAYNYLIRTISLNPTVSKYHASYSQISLALATTLAKELNDTTALSDDARAKNRDLIAQLVQQAIREAKIAVHLNPKSILAWENLARTYQLLIGVAQGADAWATTTLAEVVQKDPVNPVIALDLGGVLIRREKYTEAINTIKKAVALKPDYINAWYNLSFAYKLSGDTVAAQKTLEHIQTLVPKNSPQYRQVAEDLANLDTPQETSPSGFLLNPQIELSNEAAP